MFASGIETCAEPVFACLEISAVFLQNLEAHICFIEAIVSSVSFAVSIYVHTFQAPCIETDCKHKIEFRGLQ